MRRSRPRLAARRRAAGFTQESLAERLSVDRSTVARWEAGDTEPQPWLRQKLAEALGISTDDVAALLVDEPPVCGDPGSPLPTVDVVRTALESDPDHDDVEACRQSLHDVLADGGMSQASLDDWELTVLRYGVAAKDRAPAGLLADLASDFNELQPALARCHSATSLRRLTRVAAHLSGLMCLTLIKLDDRPAFRRWTRTARIAAVETDNPVTYSWVLAQEAYGHFYSHDHTEAVAVAQQAQAVAGSAQPGQRVGAVLAAALEARAHAARGRAGATHAALRTAETLLGDLDSEATVPTPVCQPEVRQQQ
jgi:transcriptional regulator with XRE-family HTH domain